MRDFFKENKRLLIWLVILAMMLLTIKGAAAADSQSVYFNAGNYFSGSNFTSFIDVLSTGVDD